MCRYLLSQTYTPKPDTTQRNSKESCIPDTSHAHTGRAMTFSKNNSRCGRHLQSENRFKNLLEVFSWKKRWTISTSRERSRCHATNTISAWSFLMVESGKKNFPVLFSGNVAQVMNFMGLLTFPFKWRGQSFPSSTVWKRRSCYKRELVRQHARDMWSKISCPATVSLL